MTLVERLKSRQGDHAWPADTGFVEQAQTSIRLHLGFAGGVIGVLLLAGILLGAVVSIPVAAIAVGKIITEGFRKPVQHLEGGVVQEVLVHEGQRVRAGDLLLRLDDTKARADWTALRERKIYLAAVEARLTAEESESPDLSLSAGLRDIALAAGLEEVLQTQEDIFRVRRSNLGVRLASMASERAQLADQVAALDQQHAAALRQMGLAEAELADIQKLVREGHGAKVQLLQQQQRLEALRGMAAEHLANMAGARARINQLQTEEARIRHEYTDMAAARRAEVSQQLLETNQRLRVAEDALRRHELRATAGGTVFNLARLAASGVLKPGEVVAEIVPDEARLIAEVQIEPRDIEKVHPSQRVFVRIHSLARNQTLDLDGRVGTVSTDRFEDRVTGRFYYTIYIEIYPHSASIGMGELQLRPGMPVEAHILTGERTPLSLLWKPLADSFTRTLRRN